MIGLVDAVDMTFLVNRRKHYASKGHQQRLLCKRIYDLSRNPQFTKSDIIGLLQSQLDDKHVPSKNRGKYLLEGWTCHRNFGSKKGKSVDYAREWLLDFLHTLQTDKNWGPSLLEEAGFRFDSKTSTRLQVMHLSHYNFSSQN